MPTSPAPFSVRPLAAQDWPHYRDLRLRSLAESPDAFCSAFASEQSRTPDNWAARLAAAAVSGRDYPLIAEAGGMALGLLWAKVDGDDAALVNLFQVWVAPESRGRGVAAALLQEAIGWAGARGARAVQLSVTCGDTPAMRLYRRFGFRDIGAPTLREPASPLLEQAMRLTLAA